MSYNKTLLLKGVVKPPAEMVKHITREKWIFDTVHKFKGGKSVKTREYNPVILQKKKEQPLINVTVPGWPSRVDGENHGKQSSQSDK